MFSSLCWLSLLFLFALFRFSVLFLFRCFLFSFSFFASFSSFLLLFLGLSFICFVLSSSFGFSFPPSPPLPLLPLFLILLFVPVLVSSSLSSGPSFSASFSVFSSLSPTLAFPSLPPLSSPLFFLPLLSPFLSLYSLVPFMLAILPSRQSSLPLWWFPLLPLCILSLWPSLSLSLRFWVVLVLLCVSRVGVFGPGVLLSYMYLCLLSSSLVGSFLCLCFCFFCLLLSSSLSSLFCYSSTWFLPVASAAVPLSPAPSSSTSLLPLFLSLSLFGSAGGWGGLLAPAQRLHYLDNRRWSLLLIRGFLHGFCSLFSVPPAVASGFSSLLAPPSSSLGLRL